MANPQLENGHISIATDIWEALTAYRIPGEQMQCLLFIIRKTYGWKKKQDAIPLSQFVSATGMQKPSVVRALKGLLTKKLIRVNKRVNAKVKVYEFVKDFEQWQPLTKKLTHIPKPLTKKLIRVNKKVNLALTKKSTSKETTKETIQKKTAFQKNAVDAVAVAVGKNGKSYLSKNGRKLQGRTLETFNEFWNVFDWKKDKSSAADSWLDIKHRDKIFDQIIAGAKREASCRPELKKTNSTPKWAQGWLTARRWEDEVETAKREDDPWEKL